MQMTLFPTDETPETFADGAVWWRGNWQLRNWRGWMQQREGGFGPWQFYVTGFSGPEDGNGIAHVYRVRADGSFHDVPVPINARSQILIEGRRWGRGHWNH